MRRGRVSLAVLMAVAAGVVAPVAGAATTVQDPSRNGWVPTEPELSPSRVAADNFGERFRTPVDGQIYASPVVDGGLVLVATETNHVYGLDAEDGQPLWQTHFGPAFDAGADPVNCSDLTPTVGVTGTPALDAATHTMYLVGKENTAGPGQPQVGRMLLHALDTRTGQERAGWPVELSGRADNHPDVAFDATWELQRPQLLLLDGTVYIAFGGHCDHGTYQGWVFGVRTDSRTISARWSTVGADATGGGIWQAGVGLASDGPGQILLATGNGTGGASTPSTPAPGNAPPSGLSESIVRLGVQPDGTLSPTDFFTPSSAESLDRQDFDFASGGPVALPDAPYGAGTSGHRLAVVGKEGIVYSLDGSSLGGFAQGPGPSGSSGDAVSVLKGPGARGVWGRPAAWPGAIPDSGPDSRGWLLVPATGYSDNGDGAIDVYRMISGKPTFCTRAEAGLTPMGLGTSSPVITSDGRTAGSATAWVVAMPARDGQGAQLVAFDATPSGCAPGALRRIRAFPLGQGTRYEQVTATGGRVYVGTLDGHVVGFGAPASPGLRTSGGAAGTVTIGESGTAVVHVRADGVAVHVTGGSVAGAAFSLAQPVPDVQLAPGDSFDVSVRFTPSAVGAAGGTLRLTTSGGEVPVALNGLGRRAGPYLQSSPGVIDFGTIEVGKPAEQSLVLENAGTQDLTVTGVDAPAAPMRLVDVPTFPFVLHPAEERVVTVSYAPTASGLTETAVRWQTDGSEPAANRSALILGTAGVRGRLRAPDALSFAPVLIGGSSSLPLAFTNDGDLPLVLTRFKLPTGAAFSVSGPLDENAIVPPHGTVEEHVAFRPVAEGTATASVEYNADDLVGARSVRLDGLGRLPAPAPDPTQPSPTPAAPSAPPASDPGSSPPPLAPSVRSLVPLVRNLSVVGATARARRLRLTLRVSARVRVSLAKRRGGAWVPLRGARTAMLSAGVASVSLRDPWGGRILGRGTYRAAVRVGTLVEHASFVLR